MSTDDPQSLANLLKSGRLAALSQELERRRKATVEIRALLPSEEASHVVSAVTQSDGEIVLVMDSPAWAARARYCVAELKTHKVRVKVLPRGG